MSTLISIMSETPWVLHVQKCNQFSLSKQLRLDLHAASVQKFSVSLNLRFLKTMNLKQAKTFK